MSERETGRTTSLLEDRVAVVTGAARGIGRALAERLSAEGAAVVVADILEATAEGTAEAIRSTGRRALAVGVDITSSDSVRRLADRSMEAFGGVDIVVNNAAMLAGVARRPFDQIPEDEWDRMMAVNVKGMWLCCRALVPSMRDRGGGSIINITSDVVLSGVPGLVHYTSSKGAVIAFTRAMARELGGGRIRVNAIAPGFTETAAALEHGREAATRSVQGRALQRPQTPDDLAGTVVFLASDLSSFMTGQLLTVNGGYIFH